MITPQIKAQNDAALAVIDNSSMSQDEKERWHVLLKTAMENCNGLTQKEKIEGIAQLLFDQTIILLNRRIREDQLDAMRVRDEESIKMVAGQADKISKVQETQQEMIDSIKQNMEKISELSQNIILINERMTSLENKDIMERQNMEERIKTLFDKSSSDMDELQQEISSMRQEAADNTKLFIDKLEHYTLTLSSYDKKQDEKMDEKFTRLSEQQREDEKIVNDKLDIISKAVTKDPESWKGVITRLFTPRTTIILIIVIIIACLANPDILTNILSAFH